MNRKNGQPTTFIALFLLAFGRYKPQIIVLTVLGFLSGLLEAIGVNALIPLLSFFTGSESGGDDFISQMMERLFLGVGIQFNLPALLIFISLLFFFKALVLILFNYLRVKIRSDYELNVREALFRKTLAATWPFLLKQKLGHLETILMIDVRLSAKLFEVIADTLMLFASLLMYIIVAMNISPTITLMALGVGAIVIFLLRPILRRIRVFSEKTALLNKEVAHLVGESMIGMKTVRILLAGSSFIDKGRSQFNALKRFQVRSSLYGTLSTAFIQPISVVFISFVFAYSFYYTPEFSFAALAALIYLIHRIFTYVQMIQGNAQAMNNLVPYLREVASYEAAASENHEEHSGIDTFQFEDKLEFKDIQFSYDKHGRILDNISFTVAKGEMIGLIGMSGAGKTTLFDLILRLFKPSSGTVLLDGKDISIFNLKTWRQHIGYVSQDVFLLNDTIANNIRFYADSVTFDDVVRAAKTAHIYDFVMGLPEQFETVVGERGMRLSVGQRQRISIARTLSRKPDILLLDEATSALDSESEIAIQEAIEQLKGQVTILVIAHRLSTVVNSDKILVLEDGKIIEEGKPKDLLKDKTSYFYKVYNIREV